jgi:hypothetical protein
MIQRHGRHEAVFKGVTLLTQDLEARHAMLLHQERILAYDLAKVLIHKPKVTVWMIMLPLLFLFFLQDLKKYKAAIQNFTEGYLKNKIIALDLAFSGVREDASLDGALATFASETRLAPADQNELHEKQRQEIACLMDHYRRLLTAKGKTYEELVKNAYPSASAYRLFLDTLFDLENAVMHTALRSNPADGDAHELGQLMQNATRQLRRRECERIFHV